LPRRAPALALIAAQAALVALAILAIRRPGLPLGVPGEWAWPRLPAGTAVEAWRVAVGLIGLAAYATFAAAGRRSLARSAGPGRQAAWVAALMIAGAAAQVALQTGAPEGYGLTKWVALAMPGSSGYYTVARSQMADPRAFLRAYPDWIRGQDALHVGTHPPGLFLAARAALEATDRHPAAARWIAENLPADVDHGFRIMTPAVPRADRAAIAAIGALTLLACAATAAPLYALARSWLDPPAAWTAAALWAVVPAATLFQPTADTAFPLLAALAMALAVRGGPIAAAGAGAVLGIGMQFTLAYLAVGLVVAIAIAAQPGATVRRRVATIAAVGAGFAAVTLAWWAIAGANPIVVWWWNQANHRRFYDEYPRSYLAWVAINPVELAVAIGLPATVGILAGFARPRRVPTVAWATVAVLGLLTLSGRSLSEVGRLWLPLMPPLLVAAAAALDRIAPGPRPLAIGLLLTGVQTLALEATIQVVYPA